MGSILICHKKEQKAAKFKYNLGADGNINSISNLTSYAFPCAMLLLCVKNVEQNIKQNLSKTMIPNEIF